MLKSVLKCIESIRIKKGSTTFKIPSANMVGGGGGSRPSWSKANFLNFFKPFPNYFCCCVVGVNLGRTLCCFVGGNLGKAGKTKIQRDLVNDYD